MLQVFSISLVPLLEMDHPNDGRPSQECKAFRLLPQGSSGSRERFSLDGEEVPFEGIQLWPSLGGHVLGPISGKSLGGSVFVGGSDLVSSCFFLVLVRWPRHDGEKIL